MQGVNGNTVTRWQLEKRETETEPATPDGLDTSGVSLIRAE